VYIAPGERRAVDEEAQREVVASEGGDVGLQALAGPQPAQRGAAEVGALHVVAGEAERLAVGRRRAGLRLGGVVEERAEAQRRPSRELVGERLGEERGECLGVLVAEDPSRVAL